MSRQTIARVLCKQKLEREHFATKDNYNRRQGRAGAGMVVAVEKLDDPGQSLVLPATSGEEDLLLTSPKQKQRPVPLPRDS